VLIVIGGVVAAFLLAQLATFAVLGLFLPRSATGGGYRVDYLRGEGFYLAIANFAGLAAFLLSVALIVGVVYRRRPVERVLVIMAGYAAASVAAGFAIALVFSSAGLKGAVMPTFAGAIERLGEFYVLTVLVSAFVLALAAVPSAALIFFAERRSERSTFFYAAAGTCVGLLFFGVFAPAGLIAGLIYWAVAGRHAGKPLPRG
jgi:hypothetical protein